MPYCGGLKTFVFASFDQLISHQPLSQRKTLLKLEPVLPLLLYIAFLGLPSRLPAHQEVGLLVLRHSEPMDRDWRLLKHARTGDLESYVAGATLSFCR